MYLILLCLVMHTFAHGAPLRIVTYNLWHGFGTSTIGAFGALESKPERRAREQAQARILSDANADIYLLQEFNGLPRRAERLARALSADVHYQLDAAGFKLFGQGYPPRLNSGLVTVAHVELKTQSLGAISLDRNALNPMTPWFSLQTREEHFALLTSVTTAAGTILLANAHLHGDVAGDRRREDEIDVLLDYLGDRRANFDAIILGGDLNAEPDGEVSRRLVARGYRDAWATARPDDPGYTFDESANPLTKSLALRQLAPPTPELAERERRPRRIDYVWVADPKGHLAIEDVRLLGLASGERSPSDHFGVCVDLMLR